MIIKENHESNPQSCRIPKNFIPHKYSIIMSIDIKTLSYSIILQLDLEVINPSKYLILNAIEKNYYTITSLSLQRYDRISDIFNEISNTFTYEIPEPDESIEESIHIPISAESPLFKNDKLLLIIQLKGMVQIKNTGFYFSFMPTDLRDQLQSKEFKEKYNKSFLDSNNYSLNKYLKEIVFAIISEPVDSRTIFPCYDEPCYKSIFSFKLQLDKFYVDAFPKLKCLANGELIKVEEINDGSKYEFTYSDTPLMSIYLFTLVIGCYDFLESKNDKGTKIRVFTPINEQHDGALAMEIAQKSIKFFESFFDIPYIYPKMDLVSIPLMAFRALENWGCIVFAHYAMLFTHFQCIKEKIFISRTISHEISHMWFGNLVTMEWWNELWLNEGFARIFEFLCCMSIIPGYAYWEHFCEENREYTFIQDEKIDTHPVKVEVPSPRKMQSIFDQITYSKGSNIIKMLYEYIGENAFKQSVRLYLKKFAYKNTVSEDLWQCFNEITQQDIKKLMNSWIELPGHPIVDINLCQCKEDNQWTLSITQSPIIQGSNVEWIIPLFIKTYEKEYSILFQEKSTQLPIEATFNVSYEDLITKKNFIIVNANMKGYYRVNYISDILYKNILTIRHKDITSLDLHSLLSYQYSYKKDYCKFLATLNQIKPITNHLLLRYSWQKYKEFKKMFVHSEGYESLYDKPNALQSKLDSFFFDLLDKSLDKKTLMNKLFIHDDNANVYKNQLNDEYDNLLLKFLCLIGEDKEIISFIINQFDTQFIFTHKNMKFSIYEIIIKYTYAYTQSKEIEEKYFTNIINDISSNYNSNSHQIKGELLMSATNISYLSDELSLKFYQSISSHTCSSTERDFYSYIFGHQRNMKRIIDMNIEILNKAYKDESQKTPYDLINYLINHHQATNKTISNLMHVTQWICKKIQGKELIDKVRENIKEKIMKLNGNNNNNFLEDIVILMKYFFERKFDENKAEESQREKDEKNTNDLSIYLNSLSVKDLINSIDNFKI